MSLTVGHSIFANCHFRSVAGTFLAGDYALDFAFQLNLVGQGHLSLFDLTSDVETVSPSNPASLGRAYMLQPWVFHSIHPSENTVVLQLRLSRNQIEFIERHRDGAGLVFKHSLRARCFDSSAQGEEQPGGIGKHDIRHEVNQSAWIKALDGMGYASAILVEVPTPSPESPVYEEAIGLATGAERHLKLGHYTECVVECRKVFEIIKQELDGDSKGIKRLLRESQDDLERMDKHERRLLLQSAAHHYVHLAAHRGEGFSRSEAQMIYTITMSLLSQATRSKIQAQGQS